MLPNVDDTAIVTDVDTSKLPWTPCIVVCGRCAKKDLFGGVYSTLQNRAGEISLHYFLFTFYLVEFCFAVCGT